MLELTGSEPWVDLTGKKLRISRWTAIESIDGREVVIFHSGNAARLQVSRSVYDFLRRFKAPATVAEALGREPDATILGHIRKLVAKGFLADSAEPDEARRLRRTRALPFTLWNGPSYQPGAAAVDVSILGLPYDLASSGDPGSRDAPVAIRRRSLEFGYRIDFVTGRPSGWFDAEREKRILEGVTFDDRGDVMVQHGEPQRAFFDRAGELVDEILDAGSLPVILGGDHSVTFPVVERLVRRRKVAVLHLDAHTDSDPSVPEEVVSAQSVGLRLLGLKGVERLVHFANRGYPVNAEVEHPPEGVEMVNLARHRRDPTALLAALPEELPVYVTLDMKVLDPAFAPGTSCPTPGGLNLDELKAVLHTVGASRDVVGFDLVELHPGRDIGSVTAITACHLLLAFLGEVMARRAAS